MFSKFISECFEGYKFNAIKKKICAFCVSSSRQFLVRGDDFVISYPFPARFLSLCSLINVSSFNRIHCSKPDNSRAVQSVERATPGEEVLGSSHAVATRSLLIGPVSV